MFFGGVAGPGDFKVYGRAILHLDQGRGEVVYIERKVFLVRNTPITFSETAVSKFSVSDSRYGGGLEVIHEVQAHIQVMYADVVDRTGSSQLLVAKPSTQFGDTGPAKPVGLAMIDFSQFTFLN